jgi:tRNA pseudouridine65 synthase
MCALNVLYIDEHFVVIDKPAGLSVHPNAGQTSKGQRARREGTKRGKDVPSEVPLYQRAEFVTTLLRRQLGRKIWPVHRLDEPTSGCLLCSFSSEACGVMNKAW